MCDPRVNERVPFRDSADLTYQDVANAPYERVYEVNAVYKDKY